MKTPDPTARQARLVSEIARKFPDLYEENFELLGATEPLADGSDPCDTGMTRETAVKVIKGAALEMRMKNMIAERAPAEQIQRIKDEILDLWN
jgi:hypothetical protein